MFRLSVTVAVREVLVLEAIGTSTSRWSVSRQWVVAIGLIRLTHLILLAWGVLIVIVPPYDTVWGTLVITGRLCDMYGGL